MEKNGWTLIYYETSDGERPVMDFIDSRSRGNQVKIFSLISFLEERRPKMKTFRSHLNTKLKDKEFKEAYDEEREMIMISLQLLDARKKLGISQQELAKKAHITQQQLSKIESGMNCNLSTFLRVCHALQVKFYLDSNKASQLSQMR